MALYYPALALQPHPIKTVIDRRINLFFGPFLRSTASGYLLPLANLPKYRLGSLGSYLPCINSVRFATRDLRACTELK